MNAGYRSQIIAKENAEILESSSEIPKERAKRNKPGVVAEVYVVVVVFIIRAIKVRQQSS